jgi:hypothetical protein
LNDYRERIVGEARGRRQEAHKLVVALPYQAAPIEVGEDPLDELGVIEQLQGCLALFLGDLDLRRSQEIGRGCSGEMVQARIRFLQRDPAQMPCRRAPS